MRAMEKKSYIAKSKVGEVRNIFKARVGMTEFAENFSKDKRFLRTNWLCRCGNERESEDHITKECLIYDDIRKEYEDLNDDSQLASFFSRVLERREWSTTSTKARTRRTPWWLEPLML